MTKLNIDPRLLPKGWTVKETGANLAILLNDETVAFTTAGPSFAQLLRHLGGVTLDVIPALKARIDAADAKVREQRLHIEAQQRASADTALAEFATGSLVQGRNQIGDLAALTPLILGFLVHGGDLETRSLRKTLLNTLTSVAHSGPVVLGEVSKDEIERICKLFDGAGEMAIGLHASDCAQHNEPAMPAGACDCADARVQPGEAINARPPYKLYPHHKTGEFSYSEPSSITEAQLDDLAESMPDGIGGYMKVWGYHNFARAAVARFGMVDAYHGAREDLAIFKNEMKERRILKEDLQRRNDNQSKTIEKLIADVKVVEAENANRRKTMTVLEKLLSACGVFVFFNTDGLLLEARKGL